DARQTLSNFVKKYCPSVELVGQADGVKSGVQLIKNEAPDIIFLDVRMMDGTGFDLLDQLDKITAHIIFTTAYDEFALKAFRYSAMDYLLKPIDPDELMEAVRKATSLVDKKLKFNDVYAHLRSNLKNSGNPKIAVSDAKGITYVNFDDIVCCRSSDNYTVISLKNNSQLVATKALKEFEDVLSGLPCFRIHNTSLINMNHVVRYIRGEGGFVIMTDKTELEVSRRKKKEFLEKLGELQKL
ncbi:MAG: response regulator transcription factor, partial [Bacteroidetes bacterium]|nr:response regulator transcription factor [Bacteroidota bacterium]